MDSVWMDTTVWAGLAGATALTASWATSYLVSTRERRKWSAYLAGERAKYAREGIVAMQEQHSALVAKYQPLVEEGARLRAVRTSLLTRVQKLVKLTDQQSRELLSMNQMVNSLCREMGNQASLLHRSQQAVLRSGIEIGKLRMEVTEAHALAARETEKIVDLHERVISFIDATGIHHDDTQDLDGRLVSIEAAVRMREIELEDLQATKQRLESFLCEVTEIDHAIAV